MIWLTWRQFRGAAAMLFAALAAFAVALGLTGPGLAHDFADGTSACVTESAGCGNFFQGFYHANQALFLAVTAIMIVLPALIGLFWGAPLIARELETGTHRLVWNQTISRTRWLTVKLTLVGLASTAAAGLGTLAVTWWSGPVDKAAARNTPGFPRLGPFLFDARGIAPIGYAAFAFALGVVVGMLARRTLTAMAVTLAVFVAVQVAMPLLVRPHLVTPVRSTNVISASNVDEMRAPAGGGSIDLTIDARVPGDVGAWVLSSRLVDAAGRTVHESIPMSTSKGPCAPRTSDARPPEQAAAACFAEIKRLGYRQQVTYQPSSRYWTFQWYEAGIFTVLALGLAGFGFWRIRRRLY
jgi:ABC-2 family transporter protein